MGYRSQYSLSAPAAHHAAIHAALSEKAYPHPSGKGPDAEGRGQSPFVEDSRWADDECKWYSRHADCVAVSRMYPGVRFVVFYLGEDDYRWQRAGYGND